MFFHRLEFMKTLMLFCCMVWKKGRRLEKKDFQKGFWIRVAIRLSCTSPACISSSTECPVSARFVSSILIQVVSLLYLLLYIFRIQLNSKAFNWVSSFGKARPQSLYAACTSALHSLALLYQMYLYIMLSMSFIYFVGMV